MNQELKSKAAHLCSLAANLNQTLAMAKMDIDPLDTTRAAAELHDLCHRLENLWRHLYEATAPPAANGAGAKKKKAARTA